MITGFEEQTHDLSEEELKQAAVIARKISACIGRPNQVTNAHMVAKMKKWGHKTNAARVRKIINYLRTTHTVKYLVADNKGYWIATKPDELLIYLKGLNERIAAQVGLHNAIEQQFNNLKTKPLL